MRPRVEAVVYWPQSPATVASSSGSPPQQATCASPPGARCTNDNKRRSMMKSMNQSFCRQLHTLWAAIAMGALLAGCASTPTPEPTATEEHTVTATTPSGAATAGTNTGGVTGAATSGDVLHDPHSVLSKRSVYFDYDSYA